MRKAYVLPALALFTAACSAGDDSDAGGGGLTQGELQQLEKAAERIDARPESPGADGAEALEADVRARLADERAAIERR